MTANPLPVRRAHVLVGAVSGAGFSLFEVIVALGLLTLVVSGVVQLLLSARRSVDAARRMTAGTALAEAKLAQLQSLRFGYDATGIPVTDLDTEVAANPERSGSGAGLRTSPSDALQRDAVGYCDFVAADGSVSGGDSPAPGVAFVRRWSVRPLPAAPADALVIQVRVLDAEAARRGGSGAGDVIVTTVLSRTAS